MKKRVSVGTFLPALMRGLQTCQFLRWPDTESLIFSKCSLPFSCPVYVRASVGWRERKKRKRMQRDTERRGRWMQHIPILPILHSVPQ